MNGGMVLEFGTNTFGGSTNVKTNKTNCFLYLHSNPCHCVTTAEIVVPPSEQPGSLQTDAARSVYSSFHIAHTFSAEYAQTEVKKRSKANINNPQFVPFTV